MAENWKMTNGSSEESLPLSQDTMNTLWDMMGLTGREEMLAVGMSVPSELSLVPAVPPQPPLLGAHIQRTSSTSCAVSSLPATSNWPGVYDFHLQIDQPEKASKQINWTYSSVVERLYVRKDALCPFNFATNRLMTDDVVIRAMAVYSSPEHASRVVTRCMNHAQPEIMQGRLEAEHLIRADNVLARYEIDAETKRHSVVVPFENPAVGETYSTYIFRFDCYSSCSGGPNRRLLNLVFTLEQGTSVLGRIALDLKICACPRRDHDRDLAIKEGSSPPAKKPKGNNDIAISRDIIENYAKRKKEEKKMMRQEYSIKVDDKDCYLFLRKMKRLYKTNKAITVLGSLGCEDIRQYLKSSSDETE